MPPNKRARADTTGNDTGNAYITNNMNNTNYNTANIIPQTIIPNNPLHSTANLTEIISLLTPAMQRKFLTEAASNHPDVMASLNKWNNARLAKISKQQEKELTTVISFNHMIDKVIDLVDKQAAKDVSASKGYDLAFALIKKIEDNYLKVIVNTTKPESLFETKCNAIETVRDIFEICLLNSEGSMVGRIMRQNFHDFGPYLRQVLGVFSREEMLRLMGPDIYAYVYDQNGNMGRVPWIEAFERTVKHTKGYCVDDDNGLWTSRALAILNHARGMGPDPAGLVFM